VDLYIGGTEHAVGHLLYSRMWTKVLYDLGYIGFDEPFKRLVNQGMIQGSSRFVYRVVVHSILPLANESDKIKYDKQVFVSKEILNEILGDFSKTSITIDTLKLSSLHSKILTQIPDFPNINAEGPLTSLSIQEIHVDVNIVDGFELDKEAFKKWRDEYKDAVFITEDDGKYICGVETEKMSKSKYNTVNPDVLVDKYGADTFRMYEMFLGPVEMSKPWDTKGIEGVHRFLKKLWRLFNDEVKGKVWTEEAPTEAELKLLHKTIKNIEEVTERFSFNTGVSGFMIAVNELTDLKCHKRAILEPLLVLLTPYAPHIAAELWVQLGNTGSILDASYPAYDMKYVTESSKEYPISVNGKLRTTMVISLDATQAEVEQLALANDIVQKWLEGKPPKKIIFIKGKMVNVVV
jgi:leucyl-tRNA synthetase